MSDLKKENLVNRAPADMYGGEGIRFTEDQFSKKEAREKENARVDKKFKDN
ncbi:hypothetical protein [Leeuwenhoekiella sp. MAR_2009_132]|uniref:hypothetical protein n=1 Tax=Leeuwenhoekiella sp. MAR_2009_132 TaxID=1392489 RepID=UPI00131F2A81|nr:hypothetical protein [Leeuwenhoekiella sp. MAR_2009_132]